MNSENNNQKHSGDLKQEKATRNRLVGPGLGLVLLGLIYFIWYIMPFSIAFLQGKPLYIHNWGYSIIFLTVGLAWYHKSVLSRAIALIQASYLPILASGSVDPFIMVFIIFITLVVFGVVVIIERRRGKFYFQERLQKRPWEWLNLHLLVVSWLLIIHIGLVFLVVRAPTEISLLEIGSNAGWLKYYPPELIEISTWMFDIAIIAWGIIVLFEQFKMGYNFQNKPWPRWSFWAIFIAIGAGLIGLIIQAVTYGFQINNILELLNNTP
jgi:hypothetical protein